MMARHSTTIGHLENGIFSLDVEEMNKVFLLAADHRALRRPRNLAFLNKKICVSPGRITGGVSQTVPREQRS